MMLTRNTDRKRFQLLVGRIATGDDKGPVMWTARGELRALGRYNLGYHHITQAVMGRFEKVIKHGICRSLGRF